MKIEIMQIRAGDRNQFMIFENQQLRYQVTYDGNGIFPGLNSSSMIQMKDVNGNSVFHANCTYKDQLKDELQSIQSMFTGEATANKYRVCMANGMQVGAIYEIQQRVKEEKLCVEFQGRALVGQRKRMGEEEYFSIYDGQRQVGQLTKKGFSFHSRDAYIVHLIPGYEGMMPIMAFFAVYYDYKYHNDSTIRRIGKRSTGTHSVGQNGYNPNFICHYFGPEEPARMDMFFNAVSQGAIKLPQLPT